LIGSGSPVVSPRHKSTALALLCFAAGTMDTVGFLALGHVFTSAMSGNTILLGLTIGQGQLPGALRALAAFGGYIFGVAAASITLKSPVHGIRRTLGVELLLLAIFAGWWEVRAGSQDPSDPYGLIILSAVAMGLQGGIGRAVRVTGATIVITNTVTAIVGGLAERWLARQRPLASPAIWQQIAAFLAYLGSAVIAGLAVWRGWLAVLPFVPFAAVLAVWLALRSGFVRLDPD